VAAWQLRVGSHRVHMGYNCLRKLPIETYHRCDVAQRPNKEKGSAPA
jgi:hypothetical protein